MTGRQQGAPQRVSTRSGRRSGRTILGVAAGLLILSLAANVWLALRCSSPPALMPLDVIGDVERVVVLPSPDDEIGKVRAVVKGRTYTAMRVSDVLSLAGAVDPHRLTFIGYDGRMAGIWIDGDPGDSYFALAGQGLQFVSDAYPINTWVRNIRSVIVEGSGPVRFRVTSAEGDLAALTPGELLLSDYTVATRVEGGASMESGGEVREGMVLARHKLLDLYRLAGVDPGSGLLAVGTDGSMLNAAGGRIAVGANHVYLHHPGAVRSQPLAGVVVDPPVVRVTDLYGEALDLVAEGRRVLAVMIDGIGHIQFAAAVEQGIVPTLASGDAVTALTVYPPITPVATAAMLTGRTPDQTGVRNRGSRQIQAPTVFDRLREAGKRGVFIQGSVSSLDLGEELILNPDRNADGSTDDEVFERTLEEMKSGPDFIFVHFKSTDYAGHEHGPLAPETMARLAEVDGYLAALLSLWDGPAIVLSDHGMRMSEDGGVHGELRHEEMFVPYIRFMDGRQHDPAGSSGSREGSPR